MMCHASERGFTTMLRIAVCDDEAIVQAELSKRISANMQGRHTNYMVSDFVSGEELLMDISEHGIFDLIFLDIELTRIDGIVTAGKIREQFPQVLMIFISNYSQYYKAAFDVQPFQFLDKPINDQEFNTIFERVYKRLTEHSDLLSFYYNRVHYNIHLNEILYFESNKRIVNVVCATRRYVYYGKLDEIEKRLSDSSCCFLRIHKSYLVNLDFVEEYRNEKMQMTNHDILAISYERRKRVKEFYMKSLQRETVITGTSTGIIPYI